MEQMIDHQTNTVRLELEVSANPQSAFEAWTQPELISKWMGPEGTQCQNVDLEPKQGGQYRFEMKGDDIYVAFGKYLEFDPYNRLKFSWQWKDGTFENSEVLVEFKPISGGTLVQLHHTLLPNDEARKQHAEGWASTLKRLGQFFSA